jgi:hypothetical protein
MGSDSRNPMFLTVRESIANVFDSDFFEAV